MGFDIRVKNARGKKAAPRNRASANARECEQPGCEEAAESRVTKSPEALDEFLWLCPAHAREHNKNWDYFAGKSEGEATKMREQSRYGDRPTWTMAKNGRASAAARAAMGGAQDEVESQLGFSARSTPKDDGVYRDGRRLTRLQAQAFRTLNLKPTCTSAEIRKRYAELVKRFHPDSNEGDRSAEAQLQEVIKAHQLLKKANFI
ncbi:J domain-containing protein [Parvularcula sp. LCG005]|uniref:J domain-containing protein n=1 Tax=Parvularcula sp. LCG005 TaxID=3078805 RepID=UPI00294391B7|nr:J domain-containing protein [Parvularcula sp. LCG005]WOI52493.1 J domain-containing protein [Parvularcula sp. LCG005]